MKALVVEPGQAPKKVEIADKLSTLQEIVGGKIECVYPFSDPVAIICNEEGKIMGLPANRGVYDEEGELYDILCGTFLITGLSESAFADLSDDLIEKYGRYYQYPEIFILKGAGYER